MKTTKNWRMILFLLTFMILALMFPSTAYAQAISTGDTVNQGEVIDSNAILNGTTVVMNGVINGDLLAVGNTVKIGGDVNGDLVVIGGNVVINGSISGSAYISAGLLAVGPQASVGSDVTFIGGRFTTDQGSKINRDLNIIGLESNLAGEVNRKVNAMVGPIVLAQKIYEFLIRQGWLPQSGQLMPGLPQPGGFNQPYPAIAFGLPSFKALIPISAPVTNGPAVALVADTHSTSPQYAIDTEAVKSWAVPMLRNLVGLMIIGLLIVWLVPAQLKLSGEQTRKHPWRALLYGLLVFILGWLGALLACVLVLALTFFFYWASLPNLGFLTGALGLISVGLAITVLWFAIAYVSKIIVVYLVVALLFKRWIPSLANNRVLPLVIGVIVYALLASIPYLGMLIAIITTLIGLGALWMFLFSKPLPEPELVTQPEPVETNPEVIPATEGYQTE